MHRTAGVGLIARIRDEKAEPSGEKNVIISSAEKDTAMRAFVRRFIMHYGIYRRYPLARIPAFRNAWRISRA